MDIVCKMVVDIYDYGTTGGKTLKINWKTQETEHYIFHYMENSLAELEIASIMEQQEKCFEDIQNEMNINVTKKITYWICQSRAQVGECSGFGEQNTFAYCDPDNPYIYCVYNNEKKGIGYHEDAHIIACFYSMPNSTAIKEGLAMYFDKLWWNEPNEVWVKRFIVNHKYVSVCQMISDDNFFYDTPSELSYPIMGAFTKWIIQKYGIEKYKKYYMEHENWDEAFYEIYGNSLKKEELEFKNSISKKENFRS